MLKHIDIVIIMLGWLMLLLMLWIARFNAKIDLLISGKEYKNFWKSVFWPIGLTIGYHPYINPFIYMFYETTDQKIIKIIKQRNNYTAIFCILFVLLFGIIIYDTIK